MSREQVNQRSVLPPFDAHQAASAFATGREKKKRTRTQLPSTRRSEAFVQTRPSRARLTNRSPSSPSRSETNCFRASHMLITPSQIIYNERPMPVALSAHETCGCVGFSSLVIITEAGLGRERNTTPQRTKRYVRQNPEKRLFFVHTHNEGGRKSTIPAFVGDERVGEGVVGGGGVNWRSSMPMRWGVSATRNNVNTSINSNSTKHHQHPPQHLSSTTMTTTNK